MNEATPTRRGFVASALTSVPMAAIGVHPAIPAKSAGRVIGANDRIRVGVIGAGMMGTGHLRAFVRQQDVQKDIEVAAVADVYRRHRDRAQAITNIDRNRIVVDYREVLMRRDVDAVLIASPDHWHAQMAIDAFAAGKDVYLQKPITLTVGESTQVIAAAKKYDRVLQIGSQFLSDPRWHKAREIIASGALGKLLWAQTTYSRNSIAHEWNYYIEEECTPETVDWKRWLGPARQTPFSGERFFRWRKYWEYSNGVSSDLYYHRLGPLLFAMGAQYPTRVTGAGGIYHQKDREVPDTFVNTIEYEEFTIVIAGSMANAASNRFLPEVIYGNKATMVVEPKRVVVYPEPYAYRPGTALPPDQIFEFPAGTRDNGRLHTDNFFSCMRSRKTPVLGPELAHQIMTAIGLACESYRGGSLRLYDSKRNRRLKTAPPRDEYRGTGTNHADGPQKET